MTINFERAALRHFNDASALHQDKRFANADHLAGLAAECALKVALPKRANGDVEGFREHVDKLWERIRVQQIPRHLARLSTLLQTKHRPFADWSISSATTTGTR